MRAQRTSIIALSWALTVRPHRREEARGLGSSGACPRGEPGSVIRMDDSPCRGVPIRDRHAQRVGHEYASSRANPFAGCKRMELAAALRLVPASELRSVPGWLRGQPSVREGDLPKKWTRHWGMAAQSHERSLDKAESDRKSV